MKTLKIAAVFTILNSAFIIPSNSQIIYTNIPDTSLSCSGLNCSVNYDADLNNDAAIDFQFQYAHSSTLGCVSMTTGQHYNSHGGVSIYSIAQNEVAYSAYPKNISLNDVINSSLSWIDSSLGVLWSSSTTWTMALGQCTSHTSSYGNLLGSGGYIGVRMHSNGDTYYGWIQFINNYIVKDFAYNSIPDQFIRAGETSCTTPTVNLTKSGPLSFCAGDSVTFTANGTGYQYQWKKNNVNIAGATNKTYAAKTAGVYKCKVTNSCGSKTSGTRTVTVPCRNSNENISETLEQLSIFPNPASNSVTIKFPSDEGGEIQIINLFGQIVFSEKVFTDETKIDVNRFSEGIYVVRWNNGEYIESKIFSVVE